MSLDDLYGKILAKGAEVIREQTYLPSLVNHVTVGDREEARRKGGTVEVIVPPEFVTRDVTPGSTPPASQAAPNPSTVQITLDKFKEVNIPLTETQITQLENADPMAMMFIANAVGPIVEDITTDIASNYVGIYNYVGTAGTTPFASAPTAAQNARKFLTRSKCPRMMRQMVLNTDAYANAIALDKLVEADRRGDGPSMGLIEGRIARAYGFDWHEDVGLDGLTHTVGTHNTGYLVDDTVAVGDTFINIDSGTGTFLVGDIFTVAGDDQTYVVTVSDLTGGNDRTLNFAPAAKVAWANDAQITFVDSHEVNLAFNPYAFAFDSRPHSRLNIPGVTSNFMTWVDDMTGVTLRLEIRDEYHQTGIYLSCLFGSALVDPRLACRVAG